MWFYSLVYHMERLEDEDLEEVEAKIRLQSLRLLRKFHWSLEVLVEVVSSLFVSLLTNLTSNSTQNPS
jgi:hypothetical protein